MPKKRPDTPRFDPLQALNEKYEQRQKRNQELAQEREMKAREEAEIASAIELTRRQFDVESFHKLGEVFLRWNYGIWIDHLRVSYPRRLLVHALPDEPTEELLKANACRILAIRLLIAACGDPDLTLEKELERISRKENYAHASGVVWEYLWQFWFEEIDSWQRVPHGVTTPWIMSSELTGAVKSKLKGFSSANLKRLINSRHLVVDDERPRNRQSSLCRFRHQDPATHAVMLRSVIEFLKNRENLVSSDPWLSQLWKPI